MPCKEPEVFYTVCPYNCWPVNCGLRLEVEGGRLVSVGGNPFHDLSRGMLCVKGQCSGEIANNPNRLTSPLKRVGDRGSGRWREVSWEEALAEIADRMAANIKGGKREANALYHSHGNIVQRVNWKILTPRFANMVGITLWDGNFPCWYDVGVAQELTGYWGLHDPGEFGDHSSALINWAQDPCASMANMVPYITQLRERGGLVVTIDPRVTQTAAIGDLHIRPRLGTDVWLANAVANIIIREGAFDKDFIENRCYGFDRYSRFVAGFAPEKAAEVCEVPRSQIEKLARVYIERTPLCTNLTRGALGKHYNGVQMVRAILCLVALSGNVGIRGGGAIWGETIEWNLELQAESRRPAAPYPPNNYNAIDAALTAGAVDTFLIVGGNPLSQWPDLNRLRMQLRRVGLVVVYDLFINQTATEVGDILLPATCWLEEFGLRTSNKRIYLMEQALEQPGLCREAGCWMERLALLLGVEDYFPWSSREEFLDECLKSPTCGGVSVAELRRRPDGLPGKLPDVPFADGLFPSPSGKFEFYSRRAEELGLAPLPEHREPWEGLHSTPDLAERFPLQLITSRRNTHFHSFHHSHSHIPTLRALEPAPALQMHPSDAGDRGIKDGDRILMFNDRGAGEVFVELTTEVAPGQVSLNDCWPELNVVTPPVAPCAPEITVALGVGGQPSYQNTLVQVRKAEG